MTDPAPEPARPDRNAPGRPALTPRRGRPTGQSFHRRFSSLPLRGRVEVHAQRDAALLALSDLDRSLHDLASHRLAILHELDDLREILWPRLDFARVARPPAHNQPPLPPAADDAISLSGADLRWTCLAILARHGPQQLRDLHTLLHAHGYRIHHHHPVKALADALGQEHDNGNAQRIRRGVYALAPGFRPRRGRHGHADRLDADRHERATRTPHTPAPPGGASPDADADAAVPCTAADEPAADRHDVDASRPPDRTARATPTAPTSPAPAPAPPNAERPVRQPEAPPSPPATPPPPPPPPTPATPPPPTTPATPPTPTTPATPATPATPGTPPTSTTAAPAATAAPNPWHAIVTNASFLAAPHAGRPGPAARAAPAAPEPPAPTDNPWKARVAGATGPPHVDPELRHDADQWPGYLGFPTHPEPGTS